MKIIDITTFAIRVDAAPDADIHEVRFLGDGDDLIDRFWSDMTGLDPDDLLLDSARLMPEGAPSPTPIARCDCGYVGCGSIDVVIRREGSRVLWIEEMNLTLRFDAEQYAAEVRRAAADTTWEPPERTAARLVREGIDRERLARHGLSFDHAWGGRGARSFTVSLMLHPGPYQLLVTRAWNDASPEELAAEMLGTLRGDPRHWTAVVCSPIRADLPMPALRGPAWHFRGFRGDPDTRSA